MLAPYLRTERRFDGAATVTIAVVDATAPQSFSTSTQYGSQGCQSTVSEAQVSLGFQTTWRTSNPVGHPGTFPLTIHTTNGNETSLSVDFSDTYHQQAGMTTTSRVTGTLRAS